jgi:hypothetical protein
MPLCAPPAERGLDVMLYRAGGPSFLREDDRCGRTACLERGFGRWVIRPACCIRGRTARSVWERLVFQDPS